MPLEYFACLDDLKFILRYTLVPTASCSRGGEGERRLEPVKNKNKQKKNTKHNIYIIYITIQNKFNHNTSLYVA